MLLAGNAFIACFIYKIKESRTLCVFRTCQRSEFHCFPFYRFSQLLIRHILTGSAYLKNTEQSIVDIILRSVELHMQWTPKKAVWGGQQLHICKLESMFHMEWVSGCARSLCELQLYMKVTKSHSLWCESCCTLQVCRSRLHLQCFLPTTYSTLHYQWSVSGSWECSG